MCQAVHNWANQTSEGIFYVGLTSPEAFSIVEAGLKSAGVLAWNATLNSLPNDSRTFYTVGRLEKHDVFSTASKLAVTT